MQIPGDVLAPLRMASFTIGARKARFVSTVMSSHEASTGNTRFMSAGFFDLAGAE